MRGNAHVRFGGRTGETERPRGGYHALVRPYYLKVFGDGRVDFLPIDAVNNVPGVSSQTRPHATLGRLSPLDAVNRVRGDEN